MELSSQLAAQELIKRRKVRLSLAEWARHKGFEPAHHHLLIINEIESFLASEDEVLLLFAPPGSAKSTYVLASRCQTTARLPHVGHLRVEVNITASVRVSVSPVSVRTLVSQMIYSVQEKMLTARPSDKSAGIGTSMTSQLD
jgi:hypothetical protein